MSYSIYTDVQSEFKNIIFNASSSVTDTEVTEFISQEDAYIDSKLGKIYEIPITGTESLKVVKKISIMLVAGRIWKIIEKTGIDEESKGTVLIKKAEDMLDAILAEKIILEDATKVGFAAKFKSYNYTNEISAVVKKDTVQW